MRMMELNAAKPPRVAVEHGTPAGGTFAALQPAAKSRSSTVVRAWKNVVLRGRSFPERAKFPPAFVVALVTRLRPRTLLPRKICTLWLATGVPPSVTRPLSRNVFVFVT
jgi:hypothetical protein